MDRNSVGFMYLKNKFPRTSDAKIKEGVFIGPQTEFKQAVKFGDQLNRVPKNQHGNHSKMSLSIFWKIIWLKTIVIWWLFLYNPTNLWGVICLLNTHFLDSHLDFFLGNLGAVSHQHGEQFHQDICITEQWYQDKWSLSMVAGYCWTLRRDVSWAKYSRKSSTVSFLRL